MGLVLRADKISNDGFFAVLRKSAAGKSRHFAATQYFGRFRGEADMNRIYECAP